jgi:hypothetical protein
LNTVPTREIFDNVIYLLPSEYEILTVNPDELFDEYNYVCCYLSQKESEWFGSKHPSKKLSEVCVHLKENYVPHGNMKKGVVLLCLAGSNASIESVFSRMNYIWSERKSLFHVDTIQAILAMKTNTDLSCEAFSEKLASNPGVLKKILFKIIKVLSK